MDWGGRAKHEEEEEDTIREKGGSGAKNIYTHSLAALSRKTTPPPVSLLPRRENVLTWPSLPPPRTT